jgi:hypothetical protein
MWVRDLDSKPSVVMIKPRDACSETRLFNMDIGLVMDMVRCI